MIELKNITYRYPDDTEALRDINLTIRKGERLVIAGHNGAGKSTLFLILNGILKPHSGELLLNGEVVKYSKKELLNLRKSIGIVFQEPDHQIFSASVYEEVSFGPLNLGLSHQQVRQQVEEALSLFDIHNLKERPAHLLSYGQKKRVAIASILAMKPDTIIFDEPTAGLDPVHAKEVIELLDNLHHQGKSIIISTHDMNLAYQWADRIVVLHDGMVLGDGKTLDIFDQNEIISTSRLELPTILKIYNSLNLPEKYKPRTIEELISLIKIQTFAATHDN